MKVEGLTSQRKKSGFYLDHERETTKGFSKRPLNTEKILLSVKKKKKSQTFLLSEKNLHNVRAEG